MPSTVQDAAVLNAILQLQDTIDLTHTAISEARIVFKDYFIKAQMKKPSVTGYNEGGEASTDNQNPDSSAAGLLSSILALIATFLLSS